MLGRVSWTLKQAPLSSARAGNGVRALNFFTNVDDGIAGEGKAAGRGARQKHCPDNSKFLLSSKEDHGCRSDSHVWICDLKF
jgi:hypothetical protein